VYGETLVVDHEDQHCKGYSHAPEDVADDYGAESMSRVRQDIGDSGTGARSHDRSGNGEELDGCNALQRVDGMAGHADSG